VIEKRMGLFRSSQDEDHRITFQSKSRDRAASCSTTVLAGLPLRARDIVRHQDVAFPDVKV
jgi:hypothetical protein